MTLYELINLCIEPSFLKVKIYDVNKCEDVWEGFGDEIPEEYEDLEVSSFDLPVKDSITFNVDLEED